MSDQAAAEVWRSDLKPKTMLVALAVADAAGCDTVPIQLESLADKVGFWPEKQLNRLVGYGWLKELHRGQPYQVLDDDGQIRESRVVTYEWVGPA